ncbi:putative lipid-A-disaccharide synthase [Roseobacter sp. AzwK-3b]|uniref:lipid-A-disaccharide synthase n=1 Tax=Roseobacter sp. AzwK-3b TaxID=351016 RepID=UPI000156A3B0|nr:lipid-A-disaccharide synthase [Roseobacter sp. AzwK-3b]EDM70786.1 putative lipid-A-disaccharide synthase [Roseobacter sp. AzwK-3b]
MRVFLIAGEASGDKLGAALMAGLKSLESVEFQGIGGPLMQAEGMVSLFDMDELSVMGLAEIVPKYPHLRRRLHQTAKAVLEARPDVLITIDSPDFCLRVAKLVKAKSDIRTVHYVAPSVWAWRAGRARKMARVVDQVLALLPFEPPYMEAAGVACDFVGHPVVSDRQANAEEIQGFRERHGIEGALWMILPGSRRGEVQRLGSIFSEVVQRVIREKPDLSVVIPTRSNVAPMVREMVEGWPVRPVILDPSETDAETAKAEKRAAFGAADWALAASGTVSLELVAAGTPMVIAYDVNPLSRFIISKMLTIDTLTLVNLVSETRAVPEFNGKRCRPELIAPGMLEVMEAPGAQRAAMELTMQRLGRDGEAPGLRAARAVLARMGHA